MDSKKRFIRLSEVIERTGLSKSTIYLYINQAQFPPPLKLGARVSAWLESEVNQWIEEKISSRNNSKGGC